MKIKLLNNR